jgi:tetratricopeptide (TPR) repeat protein
VPEFRKRLAATHNNLGLLYQEMRQLNEARKAHEEALKHRRQLVEENADIPGYRQELAISHNNLAGVMVASKNFADAEKSYRDALAIQENLVADFRTVPDYQSALGGYLDNLAKVLRDQDDPKKLEEARQRLTQARRYHEAARKANPDHPTYRQFLRNHYAVVTVTALKEKDHAAAATAAEKLPETIPQDAQENYLAAQYLALCIGLVQKDGTLGEAEKKKLEQQYADRALKMLGEAIRKGWRDVAQKVAADKLCKPLSSDESFMKKLAELEAGAKPER